MPCEGDEGAVKAGKIAFTPPASACPIWPFPAVFQCQCHPCPYAHDYSTSIHVQQAIDIL
eukprot:1976086-Rhodomonas_salina.2